MPEFTTSDGVRLHYSDSGSGRPVVLVAGYLAPAASWLFQQQALAAAGYRVLSLDRRSHGESEDPPFGHRMARHGADLGEFLATVDVTDAVLVGGSQGGNAIWAMVDLIGTGRIAAIVIVDQTPKMFNAPDWEFGFYGLTAESAGTFFTAGVPATGRGRWVGPPPDRAAELASRLLPPPTPDKVNQLYPLLFDHAVQDWRDVIARVRVPTLFVAGRQSGFWPCEHAAASAALTPTGRSTVLEAAGHAANIDDPDGFNAALLEFLAAV